MQILSGRVDAKGEIKEPEIAQMQSVEKEGDGYYQFRGTLRTGKSGFLGYTVRILPHHPLAVAPFVPLLITWASESSVASPQLVLK